VNAWTKEEEKIPGKKKNRFPKGAPGMGSVGEGRKSPPRILGRGGGTEGSDLSERGGPQVSNPQKKCREGRKRRYASIAQFLSGGYLTKKSSTLKGSRAQARDANGAPRAAKVKGKLPSTRRTRENTVAVRDTNPGFSSKYAKAPVSRLGKRSPKKSSPAAIEGHTFFTIEKKANQERKRSGF